MVRIDKKFKSIRLRALHLDISPTELVIAIQRFFINGKSVSDIKRIVLLVSVYRKQKANSFVNEKKVYFKHNKMGAGRMYEILDGSEGQ